MCCFTRNESGPIKSSIVFTSVVSLSVFLYRRLLFQEGPPSKRTVEKLKIPESPHPLTYKQPRRPAQIVWHETGILKDQYQRDRQREHAMTYARCEISIKKTER